jgi:hypothetical protein
VHGREQFAVTTITYSAQAAPSHQSAAVMAVSLRRAIHTSTYTGQQCLRFNARPDTANFANYSALPPAGHRLARNNRGFAAVCTNVGLSSALMQAAVGFYFACETFAPCDALNSALLRHEKLFLHPRGLSMHSGPHVVYRLDIHPRIASHFPLPA